MKILSIGNSFSQDSTALLQLLTDEITVRNLYVVGGSLDMHAANDEEQTIYNLYWRKKYEKNGFFD